MVRADRPERAEQIMVRELTGFTRHAIERMRAYRWAGNVRELENLKRDLARPVVREVIRIALDQSGGKYTNALRALRALNLPEADYRRFMNFLAKLVPWLRNREQCSTCRASALGRSERHQLLSPAPATATVPTRGSCAWSAAAPGTWASTSRAAPSGRRCRRAWRTTCSVSASRTRRGRDRGRRAAVLRAWSAGTASGRAHRPVSSRLAERSLDSVRRPPA